MINAARIITYNLHCGHAARIITYNLHCGQMSRKGVKAELKFI